MKRLLLSTVDRWGPGVIAILALLATIWYGRKMEGHYHGLQIQINQRIQAERDLRDELLQLRIEREQELEDLKDEANEIKNWSIAVYERTSQAGIVIPPIPERKDKKVK